MRLDESLGDRQPNESGPQRSTDGGATWVPVPGAPLLQFVEHHGPDVVVGVAPDGVVFRSDDGGQSWNELASVPEVPLALGVGADASGVTRVLVLTGSGLVENIEGAEDFASWP